MKSILLLLAVAAINFAAAEDACEGKDYGKAGEFDFYVFNEGWEPQFCFPSVINLLPNQRPPISVYSPNNAHPPLSLLLAVSLELAGLRELNCLVRIE